MRILQLIDSLRPGGAERMAVSYANALSGRVEASFLCCTRMEGMLRNKLAPEVGYLFLEKKSTLDVKALFRLRKYIKENQIDLIQAHSSSFFFAVLVKLLLPEVKLVWHDHFGERALKNKKPGFLKPASKYFDAIISVNSGLENWARNHLYTKEILYVKNFVPESALRNTANISLKGRGDDFKIICLANLRQPKNHLDLLKAFHSLHKNEISLHLVGKDEKDSYSEEIKKFIKNNGLEEKVHLYGAQENVEGLLKQANLGVLSSSSEGLPVALLEYAFAGLPAVCTRVGQCAEVIGEDGVVVPPQNPNALAEGMLFYVENERKRIFDARNFKEKIMKTYSEDAVLPEVLRFFKLIYNA